jgi:hypothetical protein
MTSVDTVDFDKLASSVQSEIACILCYAITGASHNYVLARAMQQADLISEEHTRQTADMSNVDIDKASLQEIVDELSVMVLNLHDEVRHLRDEKAQMNSERSAKPNLKTSAQTSTETYSDGDPVQRVTSANAAGKPRAAKHCLCL